FLFTSSEVPARVVAFLATASIPAALYLLRGRLGEAGALLALLVLAFDAPAIALGSSASAMGFDLATTAWLFVLVTRGTAPAWAWGIAAALVASAGPVALPLVAAVAVTALLRKEPVDTRALLWAGAGVAVGVVFTTLRPGAGISGLTTAPFELFAHSYDQDWSTADGLDVVLLSTWPILVGGLAAAGWRCYVALQSKELERDDEILLLWALFAFGWWVSSSQSHTSIPAAAMGLPMALLLGPALAGAIRAMAEADWRNARIVLPLVAGALAIVAFHVAAWADQDAMGGAGEQIVVAALVVASFVTLAVLAWDRASVPTVLAMAFPIGLVPLLAATSVVAFRAGESPLPSPTEAPQARNLRDVALEIVQREGGQVVIHPDFAEQLTWPFRDSGNLVVASRVPQEAGVVIWPASAAPPDGFTALEGEWALTESVEPPTGDMFEFVRWYIDRYSLDIRPDTLVVYVRASE
ncbi:MAG TPA: hypothetical protein VFY90_07685, partial [Tepidiformaceae bacterium]|nr:hypothetical protein [Tepidiformaceae bacterium]